MNSTVTQYSPLGSQNQQRYNVTNFEEIQTRGTNNPVPDSPISHEYDRVNIQYSSEASVTYSSSLTMKSVKEDGFDLLRQLVTKMLEEQGVEFQVITDHGEVDISEISQEEAQTLVAEDGYFGVDQTSERIVDFATAIAGGDPTRLDAIKEGVERGFNEAKEAFGGWLPDISFKTYDAVMEKLDAWAESGNTNQVV